MQDIDKRVPNVEQWKALNEVIEKSGGILEIPYTDYNPGWTPENHQAPTQNLYSFLKSIDAPVGFIRFTHPDKMSYQPEILFGVQGDTSYSETLWSPTVISVEQIPGGVVSNYMGTFFDFESNTQAIFYTGKDNAGWEAPLVAGVEGYGGLDEGTPALSAGASSVIDKLIGQMSNIDGVEKITPNTPSRPNYDIWQATSDGPMMEDMWWGTFESELGFDYENAPDGTYVAIWARSVNGLPLYYGGQDMDYELTVGDGVITIPYLREAGGKVRFYGGSWELLRKTSGEWQFMNALDEATFPPRSQSGGGVIELTEADYNYPETNPDGVAVWLLDVGYYKKASGIKIYWTKDRDAAGESLFAVTSTNAGIPGSRNVLRFYNYLASGDTTLSGPISYVVNSAGSSTNYGLGGESSRLLNRSYDVKQAVGTSQGVVMSQNATTCMVYESGYDPSQGGTDGTRVAIGGKSTAGARTTIAIGAGRGVTSALAIDSVALGESANVGNSDYRGSVALGSYAICTAAGQVQIGTSQPVDGYNNSNYRLLTGLYDPQSDHDAATKGYVDNLVGDIDTALQTILNGEES